MGSGQNIAFLLLNSQKMLWNYQELALPTKLPRLLKKIEFILVPSGILRYGKAFIYFRHQIICWIPLKS